MMEQEKRMRREIANSNERRRMESINAGFQSLKTLLPRRDGEKISKAAILQQTSEFIAKLQREKLYLTQQIAQYKLILESNCLLVGKQSPLVNANQQNQNSNGLVSSNNNVNNNIVDALNCNNNKLLAANNNSIRINNCNNGAQSASSAVISASQQENSNLGAASNLVEVTSYADDVPHKRRRKYEAISTDSSDEGVGMMSEPETMVSVKREPYTPSHHHLSRHITRYSTSTKDAWSQTPPPSNRDDSTLSAEALITLNRDKLWETDILHRQLLEIRLALERERRLRMVLEEQIRSTEISRLQSLSRLSILEYPTAAATYPPQPSTAAVIPTSLLSSTVVVSTAPHYVNAPAVVGCCLSTIPQQRKLGEMTPPDAKSPKCNANGINSDGHLASPPPPPSARVVLSALGVAATAPVKRSSPPLGSYVVPPVTLTTAGNHLGVTADAMLTAAADLQRRASSLVAGSAAAVTPAVVVSYYNTPSNAFQSRQSLEAIVEAIRHLEGDQLFLDAAVTTTVTSGPPPHSKLNSLSSSDNMKSEQRLSLSKTTSDSNNISIANLLANSLCKF